MKIEVLKQIIREEIEKELNEAREDPDMPAVATILKSILPLAESARNPLGRMAVYVRDGILYLGEQIKQAQAMNVESPEFKQLLTEDNIIAVGQILNDYLGMENLFVSDFTASLKQIGGLEKPKNLDDVSAASSYLEPTKR